MFGAVKLTRNAIKKEFINNSYRISFDASDSWSFGNKFAPNVVISSHSWQRGPSPPCFMKTLYISYLPPFSDLVQPFPSFLLPPTPTPTALSVVLLLWLNGWSHHTWCAILLHDIMDLHMSSLGTRRNLMCVLCIKTSSLLRSDTCGFLLVIRFDHTHTHTTAHSTIRGQ